MAHQLAIERCGKGAIGVHERRATSACCGCCRCFCCFILLLLLRCWIVVFCFCMSSAASSAYFPNASLLACCAQNLTSASASSCMASKVASIDESNGA